MTKDPRPVIKTVCKITTVPKHPRSGKSRAELEAEVAMLRGRLGERGWGSSARG